MLITGYMLTQIQGTITVLTALTIPINAYHSKANSEGILTVRLPEIDD